LEKLLVALLGIQQPLRLFRRHFLGLQCLGLSSLAIPFFVGLLAGRFFLLLLFLLFVILLARLVLRRLILLRLLLRLILPELLLLLLLILFRILLRLLVFLGLLLALLFEQFIQLFQLGVARIKFQPGVNLFLGAGDVIRKIELRAAVEKIIRGLGAS